MALFRLIYSTTGTDAGYATPIEIIAPESWTAEQVAQNFEQRHPGATVTTCTEQPEYELEPA
jgi:hypothetical protein